MFSARTRWDLTANRLAELLAHKRAGGRRVLDLTETNPTRAGLQAPADVLAALADPAGLAYQPDPCGLRAARQAVSADFARRGADVAPGHVVLTASTSEAYGFLFKLLCDAGDEVMVPRPSYPLFEYLAGLEGVAARPYPLVFDGEWRVDVAALEGGIGPRTRAVIVVSPNNPTGSFVKPDEAAALHAAAARAGLALVADEVFADFPLRAGAGGAVFAAGGAALWFSLGGLSKSCGLPQLKLAWIALGGPAALRDEARARLELIADTYLSVSTPVQLAAPALLARAGALRAPIAARVASNLATLRGQVAGSAATLLPPEGGWSAVLRIPATVGEEERVLSLLEHEDVLVHPGYFFDFPHEAFLVASLLPRPDEFQEAVSRLLRVL
jgi:aspartate/methionine/tyrosine aminotransferase